jgi:hypothetical protein
MYAWELNISTPNEFPVDIIFSSNLLYPNFSGSLKISNQIRDKSVFLLLPPLLHENNPRCNFSTLKCNIEIAFVGE